MRYDEKPILVRFTLLSYFIYRPAGVLVLELATLRPPLLPPMPIHQVSRMTRCGRGRIMTCNHLHRNILCDRWRFKLAKRNDSILTLPEQPLMRVGCS